MQWCPCSPGVLVRKIGGGGKFVPLIGDTQPLSLISSWRMVRYDVNTQNSSKSMVISECAAAFRLFELVISRWDFTMSDKFSICSKFCEQPKKFKAQRHCSNVMRSTVGLFDWSPNALSNALRIVLQWKINNKTMFRREFNQTDDFCYQNSLTD